MQLAGLEEIKKALQHGVERDILQQSHFMYGTCRESLLLVLLFASSEILLLAHYVQSRTQFCRFHGSRAIHNSLPPNLLKVVTYRLSVARSLTVSLPSSFSRVNNVVHNHIYTELKNVTGMSTQQALRAGGRVCAFVALFARVGNSRQQAGAGSRQAQAGRQTRSTHTSHSLSPSVTLSLFL